MCGGGGGGYRVTNNEMTVYALDSKLIGVCLTGLIGRIAHLASRRTLGHYWSPSTRGFESKPANKRKP